MSIRVLSTELINQIAAGEVVERPASVVKELVENALDAGATHIDIETAGGGIELIRVTDDGHGIPADDLPTAFLRHATSKIHTFEDLTAAETLGFRGEALAAVAAVAMVEVTTKTAESDVGAYIRLENGRITETREAGAADGTRFAVRELFANLPARRKFLKSAAAESGQISELVTRLALGSPDVSFRYTANGSELLRTDGGGLQSAALAVFGREAARLMAPVSHTRGDFAVTGLVGRPELSRANRRQMFFYVNGRFIRSKTAEAAVMEAYSGRLTVGRFPIFILNLQIDPRLVDVNVHPAKLEAKFQDDRALFANLRDAALSALGGRPQIPVVGLPVANPLTAPLEPHDIYRVNDPLVFAPTAAVADAPPVTHALPNGWAQPAAPVVDYTIIGQAFGTYWLVEQAARLFVIDQHAAHERVLYEGLTKRLKAGQVASQRLATPLAVALTPAERATLAENLPLLNSFGYDVEQLAEETYAIRAVPYLFNAPAGGGFLRELLDSLAEPGGAASVYDLKADKIASMSCRAAVKANDRLSYAEARALITDLMKLDDPFHCPHGRPTIVEIARGELARMFLRT